MNVYSPDERGRALRTRYGLALVLALALSACGGSHHRARPRPKPAVPVVIVQVQLVAIHITGPGNGGRGLVPGEVSVTRDGALVQRVLVPPPGLRLSLAPGLYMFTGTVRDGRCGPTPTRFVGGVSVSVVLSCVEGESTD